MLRTRFIIQNLSYDDLVNNHTIPDIFPLVKSPTKKYPPFVYRTKDFSFFGVIADFIIRAGLRINLRQQVNIGIEPFVESIPQLSDELMLLIIHSLNTYQTSTNLNDIVDASYYLAGPTSISLSDIRSHVPCYVNIIKDIISKWSEYSHYLSGDVYFNASYDNGVFEGHPDIVILGKDHSTVLDIKNSSSFTKMSKESILQVLSYFALMKSTVPNIRFVGFVLPMQRDILLYDLSNWDSSPFLKVLTQNANNLNSVDTLSQLLFSLNVSQPSTFYPIGSHISKGPNIVNSLRRFATQYPNHPCQMFLANPRTGKRSNKTATQAIAASSVISQHNISYFTHAPYVINLCSNNYDPITGYWQQNILNEDLTLTVKMGGKGVVVHTGTTCGRDLTESLNIMEHMVRQALSFATEYCPLLLETPCGEGTEVLTQIEEFGMFFFRFTVEERMKLGVCIDTCHVYVAGYDPLSYLKHWEQYCQTPIKLVHYNDSATVKGSCCDRHAPPGKGHIGKDTMDSIAQWCHERSIPMVCE